MLFRIRHKLLGGHVHMRVFAGKGTLSLALCGTLVMREEEFEHFKQELMRGQWGGGDIEFVEEMKDGKDD